MNHKTHRSLLLRSHRSQERGFAALVVMMVAATFALLSMQVVEYGGTANRVSTEKQLLDTHGYIVGLNVINLGLDAGCDQGQLIGDTDEVSEALFGELDGVARDDRTYQCEALDGGELLIRGEGDPSGPAGSFRRYRVSSSYNALSGDEAQEFEQNKTTRSVIVEIRELSAEVLDARPQVMFVLDYSGSMGQKNKHKKLKDAIKHFIRQGYDLDYGVVLFNHEVIDTVDVGHGDDHDRDVSSTIDRSPGGRTSFDGPLREAVRSLQRSYNPYSYVVLVSDGLPQDKSDARAFVNSAIRGINPQNCVMRSGDPACITLYTLSVDNVDEGTDVLESLSGNAATPEHKRRDYLFDVRDPADTEDAFQAILNEILCLYGPLDPVPAEDEEDTIKVFVNEDLIPDDGQHYSYDRDANVISLYDVEGGRKVCTEAERQGALTIRYGKPRIIVE